MAEYYRTIQGDTWDMIAKKVYNDEKRMDVLMEHNCDLLGYLIFPAGITMKIPDKLPENLADLPSWRR